jgi:hypothetical protein
VSVHGGRAGLRTAMIVRSGTGNGLLDLLREQGFLPRTLGAVRQWPHLALAGLLLVWLTLAPTASVTPVLAQPSAPQVPIALQGIGGELAYIDEQDGKLRVLDLQSGALRVISTPAGFTPSKPVWSPDGTMLAFVVSENVAGIGGKRGIHVVSASGGNPRPVVIDTYFFGNVAWFPDGQRLVYLAGYQGGGNRVHTVRVDGTGNVTFPWPDDSPQDSQFDPMISPDGTLVAFRYMEGDPPSGHTQCRTGIATAAPEGTSAMVVARVEGCGVGVWADGPTWASDGKIAYTQGTTLHAVFPDGSGDSDVLDAGVAVVSPIAFSPDGSVALSRLEGTMFQPGWGWKLMLAGPDGSVLASTVGDISFGDKVQWIGQGAGFLVQSTEGLRFVRSDGSDGGRIQGVGPSFDWR